MDLMVAYSASLTWTLAPFTIILIGLIYVLFNWDKFKKPKKSSVAIAVARDLSTHEILPFEGKSVVPNVITKVGFLDDKQKGEKQSLCRKTNIGFIQ